MFLLLPEHLNTVLIRDRSKIRSADLLIGTNSLFLEEIFKTLASKFSNG